jgi:hypothetical protein
MKEGGGMGGRKKEKKKIKEKKEKVEIKWYQEDMEEI